DNFEVMVRVILEPPDDCRDALFFRRQECVDEVAATFFGKMIEIAVMKPPWPAPRRVHPFGPIGDHLPRCDARKGLAAAGHDAFGWRLVADIFSVVEAFREAAA